MASEDSEKQDPFQESDNSAPSPSRASPPRAHSSGEPAFEGPPSFVFSEHQQADVQPTAHEDPTATSQNVSRPATPPSGDGGTAPPGSTPIKPRALRKVQWSIAEDGGEHDFGAHHLVLAPALSRPGLTHCLQRTLTDASMCLRNSVHF